MEREAIFRMWGAEVNPERRTEQEGVVMWRSVYGDVQRSKAVGGFKREKWNPKVNVVATGSHWSC